MSPAGFAFTRLARPATRWGARALVAAALGAVGLAASAPSAGAIGVAACASGDTTPRCVRKAARAARRAAKQAARQNAGGGAQPDRPPAAAHPQIESGGVSPAIDNTIPLLKPGMFRLDLGSYFTSHPTFGIGGQSRSGTDLLETATLGYGVNTRLTIFAGAVEVNSSHGADPYRADFVDPRAGFVYRIATPSEFRGMTLDFVGDVTVNEPVRDFGFFDAGGSVGPIGRARFLVTRELGHGFTLQGIGGFQAAQVTAPFPSATGTPSPFGGLGSRTTTDVDGLLGLAGQYRLSPISSRLYVNGELDYLKPITPDVGQVSLASPFKTNESYAATLGASYVIKPNFALVRLTDTVTLDIASPSTPIPVQGSHRLLSNTVGLTVSLFNFGPGHWLGP